MDQEKQEMVLPDRGMNKEKFRARCTSSHITLREKLIFNMITETTPDPGRFWRPGSS